MTAPKGWCPTLHAPMESGDGLLVRLRPPRATLTASAARALASAASTFGNGIVDLTQRAGLQVRGLRAETLSPFAAAMVACGLDTGSETIAVIRSPLGEAGEVADAIERAMADLSSDPTLRYSAGSSGLPAKFSISVDGGGMLPLGEVGGDIRVACGSRCVVAPAATDAAVQCDRDDLAGVVMALALAVARSQRRMKTLVAEIGSTAVFAAAGLKPNSVWVPATTRAAIGPIDETAFGLGLLFGTCDLPLLADLANRHGDGTMRLTPWRAVVLTGVTDPGELAADARGLIVMPDDPRCRLVACPGAPACRSATVATRATAMSLAVLDRPGIIHVSGCAKRCAHHGPAALTLVGRDGRFDIVRTRSASSC